MGQLENQQNDQDQNLKNEPGNQPADSEAEVSSPENSQVEPETTSSQPEADINNTPKSELLHKNDTTGKKNIFAKLFKTKKGRISLITGLLLLIAVVGFVEPVKFAFLNLFLNGKVDVVVVDEITLVPIEGAVVKIKQSSGMTDKNGKATLNNLNFGDQSYIIEKEAYDSANGITKVKPGSNLLGPVKLHSDGVPITVKAINKLSGVEIKAFKVTIDQTDISALANAEGVAILRVPVQKLGDIQLKITAEGYNDLEEKVTITASEKPGDIKANLVPAGKEYFLSNRSGKIDVYSADLDGSNQTVVIAGTGSEQDDTQLTVSPDGKRAALISKRDGQRGPDNQLLDALFAIDLEKKTIKRIDEGAPSFSFLGWADNSKLIYRVSYNDYDKDDNNKVKRADINTSALATLYSQKEYADFHYYDDDPKHVYFTNYNATIELYGLISLDVTTQKATSLHKDQVEGEYYRIKPGIINFKSNNKDFELDMKGQAVKEVPAVNAKYYTFVTSPSGQKIAWVEARDGKGTVIVGDASGNNPKAATKDTNVSAIVRWVGEDYLIYNVFSSDETAEYILHIDSGTTTKISDVFKYSTRYY